MRSNIRQQFALLFIAVGIGLVGYGWYQERQLPVYTPDDFELAADLNLSLDLARMTAERQPPPEKISELRAAIRADVEAADKRKHDLARSWMQTGLVLIGMGIVQTLISRRFATPARS